FFLCDDNAINQKAAARLLQSFGPPSKPAGADVTRREKSGGIFHGREDAGKVRFAGRAPFANDKTKVWRSSIHPRRPRPLLIHEKSPDHRRRPDCCERLSKQARRGRLSDRGRARW